MSVLKHSLPGILFAICIILIGLFGIFQATDFTQSKNSPERMIYANSYEDLADNDSIDPKHLLPIDTLPFVIQKQHAKQEPIPIIGKVLKILSDGIAKKYPSYKDSVETDSFK
ncbi:hypothetical protein [Sporocytophaga myxococcoides]|uniref:hypothetical protein n=1 Tax=Sporocytophaga myxococcoides TaxID=153721 RepID=UPI00048AB554|nr:hypothetical protein [Sporocytophaga myxococcoides]